MKSSGIYDTPNEEVLNRLKRNWSYKGRKPTSLRWDDGPWGGWLLMRFATPPRVIIELASPLLSSRKALKAIFPGNFHNPLCQWGDFGNYHLTDDGEFNKDTCIINQAKYHEEKLLRVHRYCFGEYYYLRDQFKK